MSATQAFDSNPCSFYRCDGDGLLAHSAAVDGLLCGRHYVDIMLAGVQAGTYYREQLARAFEMRARGRRATDIAAALGVTITRLESILENPRQGVPPMTMPKLRRVPVLTELPVAAVTPADPLPARVVDPSSPAPIRLEVAVAPEPTDDAKTESFEQAAAPAAETVEVAPMHRNRSCTEVEGCGKATVSDRGLYANVCQDHKHLVTERSRGTRAAGARKDGSAGQPASPSPSRPEPLEPQPGAPDPPPIGEGASGYLFSLAAKVDDARSALAEARSAEEVAKANVERVMHELADALDALDRAAAAAREELSRP